jgi:hypothetical protein
MPDMAPATLPNPPLVMYILLNEFHVMGDEVLCHVIGTKFLQSGKRKECTPAE